jgi:hypothetical protein
MMESLHQAISSTSDSLNQAQQQSASARQFDLKVVFLRNRLNLFVQVSGMKGASASADLGTMFNQTLMESSRADREVRAQHREAGQQIEMLTKKFEQDKMEQSDRMAAVMNDVV